MSAAKNSAVIVDVVKKGYKKVFFEPWPVMLGGLLIGILSVITFAWARPWGVAGGLRNWGDWALSATGILEKDIVSPLLSTNSILAIGLLWGAFGSALMAKQFSIKTAPRIELIKGIIGGALMGCGAAMAGGCNVGGFYVAVSALSLGGLVMMAGLLLGAYLGLRYLYWELEYFTSGHSGGGEEKTGTRKINMRAAGPYIGVTVFICGIAAAITYSQLAYTRLGGLLLCGIGFGIIIQRTRFCFVRAFRDPFMTGDGDMVKAVSASIIIGVVGFTVLKWTGLRGEDVYVGQAFWLGSLLGGVVFGFGMLLAGGCGSGSVWRAGEGQVKLMLAVVCFALATSLFKTLIQSSQSLTALMGTKVYLPDYITYKWSLAAVVLVFGAWCLVSAWNEETEKFVVEM